MGAIRIPVSYGEVIDKMTILEIKTERLRDPSKVRSVTLELEALRATLRDHFGDGPDQAAALTGRLKDVNLVLWDVEDAIRECERRKSFGDEFVELARAVYRTNDERAAIKREIDVLLGSPLREEKSYTPYD